MTRHSLLLILFFLSWTVSAQQFINGSLEPHSTTLIHSCYYTLDSNYNVSMGGSWMFGTDSQTYVVSDTCPDMGSAAEGHYFVMLLHYHDGNIMTLKLDAPMLAGNTYHFTFAHKHLGFFTPHAINYGYSYDSLSQGPQSGTAPAITDSIWQQVEAYVTPVSNSQYIWLQQDNIISTEGSMVDNFVMHGLVDVPTIIKDYQCSIYPNPITSVSNINISNEIKLPCNIIVYDITGKQVLVRYNINKRIEKISKDDLGVGMYYLKLIDNTHNTFISKFVVE